MGIGSNLGVEIAEQEYEEALFEEVILEAAIRVVDGDDRQSAFEGAKELIEAQQEAMSKGEYSENEDTNVIAFLDSSLEGNSIPKGKEAQVKAISNELREQFS